MSSDLLARLRLVRSLGIDPATFRQLLLRFGSAEAAPDAVPNLASRGGGKAPVIWSASQTEAEMARVEALGARYLSVGQGLYPRALADLDSAPPLLIVRATSGSGTGRWWRSSARETPARRRAASPAGWRMT